MGTISSPLNDDERKVAGEALQGAIIDLIDLSLLAKQAHWNLRGRNFRSVHLQLDEVVDLAREHVDTLAERAIAIGVNPDGRAATVAADTKSPQFDAGYVPEDTAIATMVDILGGQRRRFRERVEVTDSADQVTQDLLIAAAQGIAKQHWMFQAML